jgi:hypothetical protein
MRFIFPGVPEFGAYVFNDPLGAFEALGTAHDDHRVSMARNTERWDLSLKEVLVDGPVVTGPALAAMVWAAASHRERIASFADSMFGALAKVVPPGISIHPANAAFLEEAARAIVDKSARERAMGVVKRCVVCAL